MVERQRNSWQQALLSHNKLLEGGCGISFSRIFFFNVKRNKSLFWDCLDFVLDIGSWNLRTSYFSFSRRHVSALYFNITVSLRHTFRYNSSLCELK